MSNYNTTLQSNNTDLQAILNTINELPEANNSVELPTLTNEGSSSDLLSGKQLIDSDGNIVEGTIPTKTSNDLTASGATVTVPAGYYASQATKSVATATQATPSITISSNGLITASATQTAGYVAAGTKSGTKQLTVQAAQTITPGTTDKIISSGKYLTGTQTIKGDANLVADNIVSGKSIFGVSGTAQTGVTLPTLTNAGTATELLSGKQLIDGSGNKVTGTMPDNGAISQTLDGINTKSITIPAGYTSGGTVSLDTSIENEVANQMELLDQIQDTINNLPDAGEGGEGEIWTFGLEDGTEIYKVVFTDPLE